MDKSLAGLALHSHHPAFNRANECLTRIESAGLAFQKIGFVSQKLALTMHHRAINFAWRYLLHNSGSTHLPDRDVMHGVASIYQEQGLEGNPDILCDWI
jgi:hypothetical protein